MKINVAKYFIYIFLLFCFLIFSASCSNDDSVIENQEVPVETLYNEAMDLILKGNYSSSVLVFEKLERQHPYSEWSVRSQVMSTFALYKAGRYSDAVLAAERFIQLHPSSEEISYVYYLIGLSYYQQIVDVKRDQAFAKLAMLSFEKLIQKFPASDYALDAKLKLDLVLAQLAGKEMEVGRYYLKRGEYLAAINRFLFVTKNYKTTHYIPEALHRLTEAYLSLGLFEEAKKSAAVLGHNFSNSDWYKDSYDLISGKEINSEESKKSVFTKLYNLIF
tara:strand:+ start:1004 stop:1831 length:828 start_codon:yes stop_codon:yes gene_type:complete